MSAANSTSQQNNDKPVRSERLFRAAVTAYCALVRPSKSDAVRLDDLTLPLLPLVSPEGRRYAAAALSESETQPCVLIRRLADEPVEISAPLLSRSRNLSDVDLIGLIGRHGVGHARAIARRAVLNPNIAMLIAALGVAEKPDTDSTSASQEPSMIEPAANASEPPETTGAADEVRSLLRGMMQPAEDEHSSGREPALPTGVDWDAAAEAYPKLLTTALAGSDALFRTALADALDVSFGAAQSLGNDDDAPDLVTVLRAMALPVEQAFLIAALAYPMGFAGHGYVQNFVRHYREREQEAARSEIAQWRRWEINRRAASSRDWEPVQIDEPANDPSPIERVLRAS